MEINDRARHASIVREAKIQMEHQHTHNQKKKKIQKKKLWIIQFTIH